MNECQYGFLPDEGTRNAIYVLRTLGERCREVNVNLYCCFIDYTKAFDRVQHNILFEILSERDLSDKGLRLEQDLYFNQHVVIKLDNDLSGEVPIEIGVRQGDVLSPDFFSIYSEMITRCLDKENGVSMNGVNLNNIRYADHTVLVDTTEKDLQNLLDVVNEKGRNFSMEMNVKKTKVLVISRDQNIRVNLKLNGQVIEQVKCFKYLGSIITDDGKSQREVSTRIAEAKQAFNRMKTVLTNLKVTMRTRLRVLRSYIEPLFLYGCETWTLMTAERNRLMATEMWFLRRMLKVNRIDKVTNEEVLHRAGTKRWIIRTIAKRQVSFFGHVIRKEKIEQLVTTGKIIGRRSRGRQPRKITDQIKDWTMTSCLYDVFKRARETNLMVADVFGHGT